MNCRFELAAMLVATATAGPLCAQCSESPFIGAPFAISFAAGDPAYGPHETFHKPLGFAPGNPAVWAGAPGTPNFNFSQAVTGCSGWLAPLPDVDCMSLGRDQILADSGTGRMMVPQDRWGAITFSVTRGTVGAPGSVLAGESSSGRDAIGADIFSYVLDGSAMPPALVGAAERVFDSREIDVGPGAHEVDALDQFANLFDSEPFISGGMGGPIEWYFTLSGSSVAATHPFIWNGTTPSGATIFVMTLQSNLNWSCPQIWKTYADMGLAATDDIDALAIDLETQSILFSTRSRTLDPILYLYYGTDLPIPVPFADPQGTPVSVNIGLINDDDVDAICAIDPSVRATALGINGIGFSIGTPRPKQFGALPPADLTSSAFRETVAAANLSSYRTFVKGWPATGRGAGFAGLFWSLADQPGTLVAVTALARNPLDPICGNPVSHQILVPDLPALRGVRVDLRWFVTDQNVTAIHEAWPIQVRL